MSQPILELQMDNMKVTGLTTAKRITQALLNLLLWLGYPYVQEPRAAVITTQCSMHRERTCSRRREDVREPILIQKRAEESETMTTKADGRNWWRIMEV